MRPSISDERLSLLAEWSLYNDVFTQVLDNLMFYISRIDGSASSKFDVILSYPKFKYWKKLVDLHNQFLIELVPYLDSLNIPYIIIKGQNLQNYYKTSPRFQRDIDIFLMNLDDSWKVISLLRHQGFSIDKIKLGFINLCRDKGENATYYLLTNLSKKAEDGLDLCVDLHAGAFPICGNLAIYPMDIFPEMILVDFEYKGCKVKLPSPSISGSLLILLAHICQHWLVTYRDINDLHVLLKHTDSTFDWEAFLKVIRKYSLDEIFRSITSLAKTDGVPIKLGNTKARYENLTNIFFAKSYLRILIERGYFLITANVKLWNSFPQGITECFTHLFYLMINNSPWYSPINNRPFRIFPNRVVQNLRVVSKQVHLELLRETSSIHRILQQYRTLPSQFTRISDTIFIYEEKSEHELIICPIGILTQAGYSQGLSAKEKAVLEKLSNRVLSDFALRE